MGQWEGAILTRRQGSTLRIDRPSSSNGRKGVASVKGQSKTVKPIEIGTISGPVAFFSDVVRGDRSNIRRWQADGNEVGQSMDAGSDVYRIAVSRDGKWIVCGTRSGQVAADEVSEFRGRTVDLQPLRQYLCHRGG